MSRCMRKLFKIEQNFLESLIIRVGFLLLLIFSIALVFAILEKYSIFLTLLPFMCLVVIIFVILFIYFNKHAIQLRREKIDYLVICFILIFCAINSFYFSERLIEGGHDQGTYLESGIQLANKGTLYIDSLEDPFVYTYPGFRLYDDGSIRHLFLPGNAVFISIFYHLFDFNGIRIANSFLLFFSASIVYFLLKGIKNWKAGVFWLLFFLLNFYTIYFSRATYVENLQLLFVWFYVYLFIRGFQKKDFYYTVYAIVPLSLLFTIRLEAFLYFIIYLLITTLFLFKKIVKVDKYKLWKYLTPIIICMVIFGSLYIFDPNFLDPALSFIKINKSSPSLAWDSVASIPYNEQVFILVSLFYMFTAIMVLMLFLGTVNFFYEKKQIKKILLLIFIIILPQFAFLVRPGIAFYLPWFMRRFWAVFIPFVIIIFVLFLSNNKNFIKKYFRKSFVIIAILILLSAIIPGLVVFNVSFGKGTLDFESKVAKNFSDDDLVIFWDRYGYENYGPPLYFLYDTNVIFDRSPAFDEEIYADWFRNYENIYIATSKRSNATMNHPYFNGQTDYIKTIESQIFTLFYSSCDVRPYITDPLSFYGYRQINQLCTTNNPPVKFSNSFFSISIHKIDSEFVNEFIINYYDPNYRVNNKTKNIWH